MIVVNPQCEWGAHSRWLNNGLIEVDLMPTNGGRRAPSQGRENPSLTGMWMGFKTSLVWTLT